MYTVSGENTNTETFNLLPDATFTAIASCQKYDIKIDIKENGKIVRTVEPDGKGWFTVN